MKKKPRYPDFDLVRNPDGNEVIKHASPLLDEFVRWFHSRGEFYAKLQVKFYTDGEPYFSSEGAECTLRDYLRVRDA